MEEHLLISHQNFFLESEQTKKENPFFGKGSPFRGNRIGVEIPREFR